MMRKLILPLLAAVLLTACGGSSAERDITKLFNQTWNANEALIYRSDGGITYDAVQWGGMVAQLYDNNDDIDWPEYKKLVFEFDKPVEVSTQVVVNEKPRAWGSVGITSLECSLEGNDETFIKQLALQTAEPGEVSVKRIYLSQEGMPNASVSVWDGRCIFGNWSTGVYLQPSIFDYADVGDKLELVFTTDTSDPNVSYWQLKAVISELDITLEGCAKDQNEWGCVTIDRGANKYTITLTANDVLHLREHGMFIGGHYLTVTQCNLLQE